MLYLYNLCRASCNLILRFFFVSFSPSTFYPITRYVRIRTIFFSYPVCIHTRCIDEPTIARVAWKSFNEHLWLISDNIWELNKLWMTAIFDSVKFLRKMCHHDAAMRDTLCHSQSIDYFPTRVLYTHATYIHVFFSSLRSQIPAKPRDNMLKDIPLIFILIFHFPYNVDLHIHWFRTFCLVVFFCAHCLSVSFNTVCVCVEVTVRFFIFFTSFLCWWFGWRNKEGKGEREKNHKKI